MIKFINQLGYINHNNQSKPSVYTNLYLFFQSINVKNTISSKIYIRKCAKKPCIKPKKPKKRLDPRHKVNSNNTMSTAGPVPPIMARKGIKTYLQKCLKKIKKIKKPS